MTHTSRLIAVVLGLMSVPLASLFAEPPFVSQLVDPIQLRGIEDVYLDGDRAFLPCREGQRLTVCSVQDPTQLRILGTFTHPDLDQVAGFALDGNTAYLASNENHQLLVVDVTDPANMKLLGKVIIGPADGPKWLYKVAYRDGYCYVALQQAKRLYVVDVRDKTQPKVVSDVVVTTDNDGPFSVMLRDQHALVGTLFGRNNRLAVVNIQDPLQPRLVGTLLGPDVCQVSGKMIGDRYFAVCWDRNSFLVVNIADVTKPRLEGKLVDERLGKPNRCEIVGDRAYLPMVQGGGISIVDLSNPIEPRFVTTFSHPVLKKTYGIAARGDLLFVGAREGNSFVVIDRRELEK